MTMFIFVGDMLVMAFMIGVAIWLTNRDNNEQLAKIANIPLSDEAPSVGEKGVSNG